MNMNYSTYPTPPPAYHGQNYDSFHRGTTPMSPAPGYYSPRYNPQTQTPSPRDSPKMQAHGHAHARRASHAVPQSHYASPRGAAFAHDFPSSRFPATPAAAARSEFVPIFEQAEPKPTRTRRASHAARPQPQPAPPKRAPQPAPKAHAKATEADAIRAGIPPGYSYKNWDPNEEPIMLLGSVFDANSLGKWIYDWTVFYHGSATPLAEMAGELWLLLIQLAGKVKRAEESMPKIRKQQSRELVEDFLESGERLWIRFAKLLKVCEDYMWKAAKKETGEKKPVAMGKNSGCEFVNSIFGRDRELEKTEKFMTGMRLWSMRFDANCNEILKHPGA